MNYIDLMKNRIVDTVANLQTVMQSSSEAALEVVKAIIEDSLTAE